MKCTTCGSADPNHGHSRRTGPVLACQIGRCDREIAVSDVDLNRAGEATWVCRGCDRTNVVLLSSGDL